MSEWISVKERLLTRGIDPNTRFFMQVNKTSGCWNWSGHKLHNGYGAIRVNGKRIKAHRLSWLIHVGMIMPEQLVLHKCDNPACVNPDHLYIGDQKQNAIDRDSRGRNGFSKKTHCKRGHAFTNENTYKYKGKRICKACKKLPLPEPPKIEP